MGSSNYNADSGPVNLNFIINKYIKKEEYKYVQFYINCISNKVEMLWQLIHT